MQSRWTAIRKRRRERRRHAGGKTQMTQSGKVVVVNESGPPCPRCREPTQVRQHKKIGERQLRAKFYFARWYLCTNQHCRTTLIMPETFKVWNPPLTETEQQRLELVLEQLGETAEVAEAAESAHALERPPWEE